ncbi:hypothetical protein DL93DRAFT_2102925 [Clavulina sp. PMI_390]|nr:hypothetical protein DL93DRAFT_2102925 [Clavulina sp. PMI_390]
MDGTVEWIPLYGLKRLSENLILDVSTCTRPYNDKGMPRVSVDGGDGVVISDGLLNGAIDPSSKAAGELKKELHDMNSERSHAVYATTIHLQAPLVVQKQTPFMISEFGESNYLNSSDVGNTTLAEEGVLLPEWRGRKLKENQLADRQVTENENAEEELPKLD